VSSFLIESIGIIAAILTTIGFVPQVYKTLKTKDVNSISLSMYVVLFVGIIFWLAYGILIDRFAIKIANTVSAVFIGTMIVLKIVYRDKN
jgi:MtN3 and saliva related transmembrane protein